MANITGTVGNCTFKKIKQLEKAKAALNSRGVELTVYEGNIYKFYKAVEYYKNRNLSKDRKDKLSERLFKTYYQN